jgi:hypothetical protein
MRPTKSIASLVVAVLVLSAWSTSSNAPQEGDACMLLTPAQVSAALGATVEAGKRVVSSSPRVCGWAPPGGPHIDAKKVTLTLMTVKSFETSKTPVESIKKAPLSGVGDDAIYITTGGFGTALNVKKGNSAFQVRVGGFKPEQEKEIEKFLALEILKKL